jgi:hypothetical protein
MSKGVAGNLPSNAQMVQLRLCRPKANLNVAEAFPVGELGEGHAEVLIPAGETDHLSVAVYRRISETRRGRQSPLTGRKSFSRNSCAASIVVDAGDWHIRETFFKSINDIFRSIQLYFSQLRQVQNQRWDNSDEKRFKTVYRKS